MSKYKLIQLGYTMFGEGDTAEDARENAREWLDSPDDANDVPVYESADSVSANCNHGDLVIVPGGVADELGSYE